MVEERVEKRYVDLIDRFVRDSKFRLNCVLMFILGIGVIAFWPQTTWYYPPTLAEQISVQLPLMSWIVICVVLAIVGKRLIGKTEVMA